MAEKGSIDNISSNGKQATITPDDGSAAISYNGDALARDIEDNDGVSYDKDAAGSATNISSISKLKIKGTLTDAEKLHLKALVKEINKRDGNGGIDINIKTKK